jgi:hypothetical protein
MYYFTHKFVHSSMCMELLKLTLLLKLELTVPQLALSLS